MGPNPDPLLRRSNRRALFIHFFLIRTRGNGNGLCVWASLFSGTRNRIFEILGIIFIYKHDLAV